MGHGAVLSLDSGHLNAGPDVWLRRPSLSRRACRALSRGALVVTAPGGYGKTSLLESALAGGGRQAAWLRCTPNERDPGHLLATLVRAVGDAVPGAAGAVAEALSGSAEAVEPLSGLRALLDEVDRLLVEPVTLVVDDAEALAGAGGSCDLLAELVRHRRPGLNVALLSRRTLGLPLAKPKTSGRAVELGPAELAFTAIECAEYIRLATGASPSNDDLAHLLGATEGWPLGVATLVLAGAWRGSLNGSSPHPVRTPGQLQDYLREEVLGALDAPTRRALLVSAVPRSLSPGIAAALGLPEGFLTAVQAQGLYLRPIDRRRGLLAYHPLFREVLLDQLAAESTGPGDVAALHRRVAPAVAHGGDGADAIDHWIAAGDWEAAVAAIGDGARTLVVTAPGLVRGWMERLPPAARSAPVVKLLEGHLAWAGGRYGEAIDWLRAALAAEGGTADPATAWWCRFLLVDCLNMTGRMAEAAGLGEGFDQPAARSAGVLAAATALYAAHSLASLGRSDEAEEIAEVVGRLPEREIVAPIDTVLRAYIDLPAGRVDAAVDRARRAYDLVEVSDPLLLRFNVMATIGVLLGEQGRFEEALEWWDRHRAASEAALMTARSRIVQGVQARLLAEMGRPGEAGAALAGHQPTGTWADFAAHVARCLIAVARAEPEEALAAAERAVAAVGAAPPVYGFWARVALAPALARIGRIDRARDLVGEAAAIVDTTFPAERGSFLRARALVLKGWLAAEGGDPEEGSARMAAGLLEAGEAAPYVLRLEWERIEPLLGRALSGEQLEPTTVVGWLWKAFPDGRALVALALHPRPEVRRASFWAALSSGNPRARASVAEAGADADPGVAAAAQRAIERAAAAPPPRIFTTLGGFGVRIGGWEVGHRDWARPVDARLVRYLLVRAGEPVAEDVLFEAFWPELTPQRARRSLHVSASRVRAVLDQPGRPTLIDAASGWYRLRLGDGDVIDWQEFEAAAATALADPEPDRRLLERARSLWGGDPLPRERYSDWASTWRSRLADRYVELLSAMVAAYERDGLPAKAIGAAREMLAVDPLDEAAHRALMAALARTGRRGQALRQYLACRRALRAELGVEPAAETSSLYGRILAGGEV